MKGDVHRAHIRAYPDIPVDTSDDSCDTVSYASPMHSALEQEARENLFRRVSDSDKPAAASF